MSTFSDEEKLQDGDFDAYNFALVALQNDGVFTTLKFLAKNAEDNLKYQVAKIDGLFKPKFIPEKITPSRELEIRFPQKKEDFEATFCSDTFKTSKPNILQIMCEILSSELSYKNKISIFEQIPTSLFEDVEAGTQILDAARIATKFEAESALFVIKQKLSASKQHLKSVHAKEKTRKALVRDYQKMTKNRGEQKK